MFIWNMLLEVRAENNFAIILNCCQQENMLDEFSNYGLQLIFCQRSPMEMGSGLKMGWCDGGQNTFPSVDLCYMVVSYQQCSLLGITLD